MVQETPFGSLSLSPKYCPRKQANKIFRKSGPWVKQNLLLNCGDRRYCLDTNGTIIVRKGRSCVLGQGWQEQLVGIVLARFPASSYIPYFEGAVSKIKRVVD